MGETSVQSLGWEDALEKGKATTPAFWPGEFRGLYSPCGHKESDTTELDTDFHFQKTQLVFSGRLTRKRHNGI